MNLWRLLHLERLIHLLEIIAVAGRPIPVADVQRATGLPKPTSYRLVQSLIDHDLVDQPGDDGKVVIGERMIRIALLGKSDADVRRCAAPILRTAATTFNETVFLARFRDGEVEIIHVETPDDPARALIHPGLGVRPMHACSCSKAIAAFTEPDFRNAILAGSLKQYTEFTKTTADALRAEFSRIVDFSKIVDQGYAECDQEIDLGIASVAAPISIGNIGATFSVGAVGPIRRFGPESRRDFGEKLKGIFGKISGAIQLCNVAEV